MVFGDQGGCERRNEELKFFVKIKKKKFFFLGGGQGGCERRIEVFCENSKKKKNLCGVRGGVGLEGVRVDVKVELKIL